jgi:hypothetical protein
MLKSPLPSGEDNGPRLPTKLLLIDLIVDWETPSTSIGSPSDFSLIVSRRAKMSSFSSLKIIVRAWRLTRDEGAETCHQELVHCSVEAREVSSIPESVELLVRFPSRGVAIAGLFLRRCRAKEKKLRWWCRKRS